MQSFELLGGKYQQGEQILPGAIQTFRSYEVPTGRPVFIHRIASNDPAAKEVADLLSAGLIRSPGVRKMLVDVYERDPYRFVVTEPARQCVPLLDWLQRETEEPEEQTESAHSANTAPAPPPPARAATAPSLASRFEPPPEDDEYDEENKTEPLAPPPDADASEFARLFHEALSGKLEKARRQAALQKLVSTAEAAPDSPLEDEPEEYVGYSPVARAPQVIEPTPAQPAPLPEPALFQAAVEVEDSGRSTLVIFLVVLGVLAVLIVMFIVVFVMR